MSRLQSLEIQSQLVTGDAC